MNKKEYVKKNVSISGYGVIEGITLDEEWFNAQEEQFGEIKDIREINTSCGGLESLFGDSYIVGCIVIFKSGDIVVAESDGEYVDLLIAKVEPEGKEDEEER